jgi:uncharacterized protein YdgA (DUF945 family)
MTEQLEKLAQQWVHFKSKEKEANASRLMIEQQILDLGIELKTKGTNTFGNLKIVTTETRKWEQEKLAEFKSKMGNFTFPFKQEYKEVAADMKKLADTAPDLVKKMEAECLTITPAKPSFSWVV